MKLAEYLSTHGLTQREFARRIGRRPSTVSRWLAEESSKRTQPDPDAIAVVQRVTGGLVTLNDWVTDPAAAPAA